MGELYFSAHRGVYTSQAAIKKGNRKSELALREAEMWGSMALVQGSDYPLARMDAAWKKLLLNHFHDILPGSSIARVYEDARRDHRWIISEAEAVLGEALSALTEGDGVTVFNSLSFERSGLVRLPAEFADGAVAADGTAVPVQKEGDGALALVTVPACGAVTLTPAKAAAISPKAEARLTDGGAVIENARIRAELNSRGEVVSFVDKASGREFAAGPMNRLLMFKDVPRLFDAWDIDSNYVLQPVDIDESVKLEVAEACGLKAVIRLSRKLLNSTFEQKIVLEADGSRLDFVTDVEWHELHRLLKVEFPVNVRATEGINEIQFGYMKRPTHRSRLYDSDRFEVCNQRYSALCDESHGAAVLNDCKYGIIMNGNALQLTLLRAAASPEMRADNGSHRFTYAFTAWEGGFMTSPVVREAYALNVPMTVSPGSREGFSAFAVDAPNVFIDTVKPAEDGSGDVILRLYEAKRADTRCQLSINVPAQKVWNCDMLENKLNALPLADGKVDLTFHTFEVKTLRLEV